jgi:hypothetical protein
MIKSPVLPFKASWPFPFILRSMPLSTDFGIFASNVEVFVINPYPSQASHDIDLRPVPKQDGHSAPIIFELSPEP